MVYVAIDMPQGKVRLYCLYNNGCQINLINQDVVYRFNLPISYALCLYKPIIYFLDSNQITIWDAYNLTVTTSDSQGTPCTIGPQTFQGGLFNSYNIVLRWGWLTEADLLISFRSGQFIQGTLDPKHLQIVTLNTLLVDIKASKIVYSLWPEDFFFMLVVNTIEDLLLLVASTYIDPPDVETLVINIIEDLLLLAASTYRDPPVLVQITLTQGEGN